MSQPDDGSTDPALAAALNSYGQRPSPTTEAGVHAALVAARVYVPGVMQRRTGASATAAKAMALLTLRASDGSSGIAAFTSLDRLVAFRSDARPLPVRGADVLASAVEEGHASVVLDVQGPQSFVVDGPALRTLARGYVPVGGAEEHLSARVAPARPEIRPTGRVPSPGLVRGIGEVLDGQPVGGAATVDVAYVVDARTGSADWERLIALVLAPGSDAGAVAGLAERLVTVLGPHLGSDGIGLMALAADDGRAVDGLAEPVWRRAGPVG